jgi:putative flippase GtrA
MMLWSLTEYAGIPYLVSNALRLGTAALWNYGLNADLTWESIHAEQGKEGKSRRGSP